MKTVSPEAHTPRVVLFGIRCAFTAAVATRLCQRGIVPSALFIPGHPRLERPVRADPTFTMLPMAGTPRNVAASDYPTFQIGHLTFRSTIETVASFAPDFMIVACFPRLIPRAIREIPRLAALNIHPSLLPAHRGPDPLFWVMRAGGNGCGVTLHELDDEFDTGDILAQQAIPYPDGARESELERRLADAGADLATEVIAGQAGGSLRGRPQGGRAASYESWPNAADFTIDTSQPAHPAWNFIRGVAERGVPVRVETDAGPVFVSDALSFGEGDAPPAAPEVGQVIITFATGWLVGQISYDAER